MDVCERVFVFFSYAITLNDLTVIPKAVGSDQQVLGGAVQQLKILRSRF